MAVSQENRVKFSLKKCFYAKATIADDGSITYATPVRIPGAVSLSLSQKGALQTLRADGVDYYVSNSKDGYEGDVEFAKIPEDFKRDILGETEDKNKVMIESINDEGSPFALLFEFDGDKKAIKHAIYLCYTSSPAIEGENPDNNRTPKTEKISIKAVPREDGKIKASTRGTTSEETLNAWYTSVYDENSEE